MTLNYTKEELQKNEDSRVDVALSTLEKSTVLYEKINTQYLDIFAKYESERRQTLKYLGTIAGGAAALAPQLIDHVHQTNYFYTGISFLSATVIISATYIISIVENEANKLTTELERMNKLISDQRKPIQEFITGKNHSVEALAKAMFSELPNSTPEPTRPFSWYVPLDYASEYVIFFTVSGLVMLALSVTTYSICLTNLYLLGIVVFLTINLISTFPVKFFVVLGIPIDLIKAVLRLIFKKLLN